jgi:hypothetical protein
MTNPNHIPYAEEAQFFADIMKFFGTRLPHAISYTIEHLDEALLSRDLFQELSAQSDEELSEMGIARDELSKVAVAASGLLGVANKRRLN